MGVVYPCKVHRVFLLNLGSSYPQPLSQFVCFGLFRSRTLRWAGTCWLGNTQPSLFCLHVPSSPLHTLWPVVIISSLSPCSQPECLTGPERVHAEIYGLESSLLYSGTHSSHFTTHISTSASYFALKTLFSMLVKRYRLIVTVSW